MGFMNFMKSVGNMLDEDYVGGPSAYEGPETIEQPPEQPASTDGSLLVVDNTLTAGGMTVVFGQALYPLQPGQSAILRSSRAGDIPVVISSVEVLGTDEISARPGHKVSLVLSGIVEKQIGAGDTLFGA